MVRAPSRRKPRALLIVTGCAAQLEAEALAALGENVLVVPQSRKGDLLALAEDIGSARERARGPRSPGALPGQEPAGPFCVPCQDLSFHTRAFLKIQDGCDGLCAYCRVPQARGGSVSLDADEVIRSTAGARLAGAPRDRCDGRQHLLLQLGRRAPAEPLRKMIDATRSARFRLSSLEPEALTDELALVLADESVCPHFHIPVQSGSDSILSRMRRRYKAGRVAEGIALLRGAKDDPFIAGDFIAGFPGETEADHAETVRLAETMRFSSLHVFPFSPRPGTSAASLTPRVPERLRDERARGLLALSRSMSALYARSWTGRVVDVLIESARTGNGSRREAGPARGVSGNYLKVRVSGVPREQACAGKIARAKIIASGEICEAAFIEFAGD